MHKKTRAAVTFLDELCSYITSKAKFDFSLQGRNESALHPMIQQSLVDFMHYYYKRAGYVDTLKAAKDSVYMEGQSHSNPIGRREIFGSYSKTDLAIIKPYKVAIEYKKCEYGSTLKIGLGQCVNHILSNDYDFSVLIFHDISKDQKVLKSLKGKEESRIIDELWDKFNIKLIVKKSS